MASVERREGSRGGEKAGCRGQWSQARGDWSPVKKLRLVLGPGQLDAFVRVEGRMQLCI